MQRENKEKLYANIFDLSQIPEPVLNLAIQEWFDREDILEGKKERIDDMWVRIIGKDDEIIRARAEVLRSIKQVRNGGGVRIKKKRERRK